MKEIMNSTTQKLTGGSSESIEFHPAIRAWFEETFSEPTPPQRMGWPPIAKGKNTLILAPTGSGKTLAAFLVCIDRVLKTKLDKNVAQSTGVHTLYISPLKALNYDIERNLEQPLSGIRQRGEELGLELPLISTAVRTGDTPQRERQRMLRYPPDILITTPESLHLILTSKRARDILRTVRYVIVDEIHALSDNKRGTFLILLLERLQRLTGHDFVRIGLSATQKPLKDIASFLGGYERIENSYKSRKVEIIDAGMRKQLDVQVLCPVNDMRQLPEQSIWPNIYRQLLELIRTHTSTLIFANNRRAVERITREVNELAGEELVQAHHGSVSKEIRREIEEALKRGELPALAATASLELGIDMGAIDLVVQVESPKSVARGLQRIGRAGHLYKAASKGRLIPKMRSDLLEMAVTVPAMREGDVAPIKIPRNCLDILAQQIVAMVAMESWPVDVLYDLVRQASPYRELPRTLFNSVLEMLSGRYPSEAFRDLRPRISWDRVNNVLHALPGSQRMAILGGGAIPDTGQFLVVLQDGATRLGEVDEEFVYETRLGDVFQLGSNTWKVKEITHDRVLVAPAPGEPAKMPFWKGEFYARDPYFGLQFGRSCRQIADKVNDPDSVDWLKSQFGLSDGAAFNLREYFRDQYSVAEAIPDDQTILIEGFRDELSDQRVAILTTYGGRLHLPWKLAIIAQFRRRWDAEPEAMHTDAGILLRMPAENLEDMVRIIQQVTADNLEELVLEELANSAFFGLRFRQNAQRAFLFPIRDPRKRTPLWLQRMKARDLLEIARRFENFPIVVETYRECLQDVLAMDELREMLHKIKDGQIKVHVRHGSIPSPFTSSLLFDFQAGYMYEYETPKTGTGAAPKLDLTLLEELLHPDRVAQLLDKQALADVEARLSGVAVGYQARTPAELAELLRRVGDLSDEELRARYAGDADAATSELTADGRLTTFDFVSGTRWISAEEFSLYNSAFGKSVNDRDAQKQIIARYLRSKPAVTLAEITERYPINQNDVAAIFEQLGKAEEIIRIDKDRAVFWGYRENLERVRRTTLARKRREIQPCTTAQFAQFLLNWQHRLPGKHFQGTEGVVAVLEQLQGLALPAEIWDSEIFGRRVENYQPNRLDDLIARGEIVWYGTASGGSDTGRIGFSFREDLDVFRSVFQEHDFGDIAESVTKVRNALSNRGACFLIDISTETGLAPSECARALWEMIWAGIVTHDSYQAVRAGRPPKMPPAEPARIPRGYSGRRSVMGRSRPGRRLGVSGSTGRWSLLPKLEQPELNWEHIEATGRQLLNRYGMLCREMLMLEFNVPPWSQLYQVLMRLEWRGEIRRGYFVQGFSGAQFALPRAADELMNYASDSQNSEDNDIILINACDPANLYGAASPLPVLHPLNPEWRLLRHPNNYLVLQNGLPLLAIEGKGVRLTLLRHISDQQFRPALELLPEMLYDRRIKSLRVEFWNDQPIRGSAVSGILKELGFQDEMRSMVLRREFK